MIDKICSLILLVYVGVVTGQNCENICYQEVIKGLKDLKELYGKPPQVINIPPMFDDIKSLINHTEYINASIKDTDGAKNISLFVIDKISKISDNLILIKKVIKKIDNINEALEQLRRKKGTHDQALKECNGANDLYTQLTNDISSIKEYGNNISKAFETLSKRIDEVIKQGMDIKRDLDAITISDDVLGNYLCHSALHATIEAIINILKSIAEDLKALFTGFIQSKLGELEKNITDYEQHIEEIEKDLEEKLPEPDLKTTSGTRPHLDDLKAQVNDLKNKIKQIKLDLLGDAKQKIRDLIKEYEQILYHIFSNKTEKKVKKEIEKAKELLSLIKEKEALKKDLEDIKKVVDTLKARGVCFINETVKVEV